MTAKTNPILWWNVTYSTHAINNDEPIRCQKIVTIGDSGMLTRTKCGFWHGYQKRDVKLHCVILTDTDIIIGLNKNLFSMSQALQEVFEVTSEGKAPIHKIFFLKLVFTRKRQTPEISFYKKMANTSGKIFPFDHQALHESRLCHYYGN